MLIGLIIIGGEGNSYKFTLHGKSNHDIWTYSTYNFSIFFFNLAPTNIAAIISYKALTLRKEVKKLIHLVLHAIALILGIIGIYAAFKYHNESSIANLYSLHSWIGIAVISLYGIQVFHLLVGLLVLL